MTDEINSLSQSAFQRADVVLYLRFDIDEPGHVYRKDSQNWIVPTFAQDEDDQVGLMIDSFGEKLKKDDQVDPKWLEVQQIMSYMKRVLDAEILGRKQKLFKKVRVNLSPTGIAFPSEVAYHPGQTMRLSMYFIQDPFTCLNVSAEVVRSEKAEIGYDIRARFKDLSEKSQNTVQSVIQNQKKP